MTKKGAAYIRVSAVGGRGGDTFHSPEVQRDRIEAWAAFRGYEIVQWYVDLDRPASKGSPRRPEFERMMSDAAGHKFSAIVVYKLTRFSRSMSEAAKKYEELEGLGVDLASATEDIDTTTAGGKLLRTMLFALAEFESERIGEEWKAVHAARRKQGIAHVTHAPFGFKVEGATIVGAVEEEAEAVRSMFRARAAGTSYTRIIRQLAADGHRPRSGKPQFPRRTVYDMLRNPLYAGLLRDGDELVDAAHEAIVDRDTWERVQAMNRRQAGGGGARHRSGLLSGLLVCGSCGYRLRQHKTPRNKGKYLRRDYKCAARYHGRPCPRPVTIAADRAEAAVEERFLATLGKAASGMNEDGRIRLDEAAKRRQAQAAKLRAKADRLTVALDRLADKHYVTGTVEQDEYDRQFRRYATERQDLLDQAVELDAADGDGSRILELVDAWHLVDTDTRRDALHLAIDRIIVKPNEGPSGRGAHPEKRLEIVRR